MSAAHLPEAAQKIITAANALSDEQLARAMRFPAQRESAIQTLGVITELLAQIKPGVEAMEAVKARLERAIGPGRLQA